MESLMGILAVGGLALCILNIALLFKIWGMTNNTKRIVAFLEATRPDLMWQNSSPNGEVVEGYFEEGDERLRPGTFLDFYKREKKD